MAIESIRKGRVTHVGTWEEEFIYRYISVDRFLEILETEKNTLAHISKWEDPNEAYLIRARIEESNKNGDFECVRQWYDKYRSFYGQSWMFNGDESDVLWRAYGRRGETVRIATTVKGVCQALEQLTENGDVGLSAFVGAISYMQEMRFDLPDEDMDLVKTLFVKRKEFSDENEFRVVVKVEDTEDLVDKAQSVVVMNGGLLKYDVVVSDLIQSVLVDPCCTHGRLDEIKCRAMNAGFGVEIQKSSLFRMPSSTHIMLNSENDVNKAPKVNVSNRFCKGVVEHQTLETRFWTMFQAAYHNGKSEFARREVSDRRYWGIPIRKGLFYYVTLNSRCARAELYIDSPSKKWNEKFYDCVRKGTDGKYCGVSGDEGLLPSKRASRIAIVNNNFKFQDQEKWSEAVAWLCGALDEIRAATKEYVERV